MQRPDEQESYWRRWNLKLLGVPKAAQENVHLEVIKICQVILPSIEDKLADATDIIHRLGKRQHAGDPRPRGIILRFVSRVSRDGVWKAEELQLPEGARLAV